MTHAPLLTAAVALLRDARTASLATADAHGGPYAANVQYAVFDADRSDAPPALVWVSSPDARHSQHLAVRPRAAVTVYGYDDAPASIHGLQMTGAAELGPPADTPEWERWYVRYAERFAEAAGVIPGFRDVVARQRFYRFTPDWLRLIDNRRGFGWKAEWSG